MTKRKIESEEIPEQVVKDVLDVWNELTFSEYAQATQHSYLYPAAFNPQLLNSRLKDLSLLSSGTLTEDRVDKALSNPKESEKELLAISENLEYTSSSYKRIISYMSSLPAWDLTYYCKNIGDISNYKSKKYQKSLDVMKDFFDRFDYKQEFGIAIKQLFRQEVFFTVLRDEGEVYTLQELAPDYSLITGRWDYGLLFSYNYVYFQQGGIDISLFPEVFKRTYIKLFTDASGNTYNPSAAVDMRGDSRWVLWADCSPADGFWCWKMSPQVAARIPIYSGLFPDLAMQGLVRGLQKSSWMSAAIKLIFGEIPMLNKDTKATLRDAVSMSPKLLGEFLALVKSAINNDAVKFTSAPLSNIKPIQFDNDNEIYSSYSKLVTGLSGVSGNLLFSTGLKNNAVESMLSAEIDGMISTSIYPYFNQFMDYQVNKRIKEKGLEYRFGFNFEGTNSYLDRQRRLETQITLMGQGLANPQKIFAAVGQSPLVAQAQLDEARMQGWTDNLTPVIAAAQMSGNAKNAGRPSKSDDELTDSGQNTRSAGSNIEKGANI